MRLFFLLLILIAPVSAWEKPLADEERSALSAVVFTGVILSIERVGVSDDAELRKARVRVLDYHGSENLPEVAAIYYEADLITALGGKATWHIQACPSRPRLYRFQVATFYCIRQDIPSSPKRLFIPAATWVKPQ